MASASTATTYAIDGTLLEACSCKAPCPCWIGDDPDGGKCDGLIAYHVDRGHIRGTDVAGLSLVLVAQIPGNVLAGSWRVVVFMDDRATPAQREALLDVFTGKLGGAPAQFAQLVGEIVGVVPAPMQHSVVDGKGSLRVGQQVYTELAPYTDLQGRPTTLHDSVFSTIPGSSAYISKASTYQVHAPEHGMSWEFSGRNAIQGPFHFEA